MEKNTSVAKMSTESATAAADADAYDLTLSDAAIASELEAKNSYNEYIIAVARAG